MFLELELDVLMLVISRELENQREVEILFSDAGAGDRGYGEFEELRLQTPSPDIEDGQFQLTSNQIKQLTQEVDGSKEDILLTVTSAVDDEESPENLNSSNVLQISPSQLEQLHREIEILDNSINDKNEKRKENNEIYREDFYEAITGVNKRLESVQAGDGDELSSTLAHTLSSTETPGTPETSPSPKQDAVDDAAVTALTHTPSDGLELSTFRVFIEHTNNSQPILDTDPSVGATNFAEALIETTTEQVNLEYNIVVDEDRESLDQDEDITTQASSYENSSLSPEISEETTTTGRFEHFKETIKARKSVQKKVKNNKEKARKLILRKIKKSDSVIGKRRRVVKDDRQKVWQRRSKSRLVKYDPRKNLRVRNIVRNDQNSAREEPSKAQLLHFKIAEAQIAKAIQLQECLNNPESCQVRR